MVPHCTALGTLPTYGAVSCGKPRQCCHHGGHPDADPHQLHSPVASSTVKAPRDGTGQGALPPCSTAHPFASPQQSQCLGGAVGLDGGRQEGGRREARRRLGTTVGDQPQGVAAVWSVRGVGSVISLPENTTPTPGTEYRLSGHAEWLLARAWSEDTAYGLPRYVGMPLTA